MLFILLDRDILLIRCQSNQLDDYYTIYQAVNNTNETITISTNDTTQSNTNETISISTNKTVHSNTNGSVVTNNNVSVVINTNYKVISPALFKEDIYQNITTRIKEQVQKIIAINTETIPKENIFVELIDNGRDSLNRSKVHINIIVISQGNL